MLLATFTAIHVLISLVAIASGFVVMYGLVAPNRLDFWTALFLLTTVLTSLTGFFFPFDHFMPAHAVGITSLLVLTVTIYARFRRHLAGVWRTIYVIGAVISLYLNVFVPIVQSFQKIPAFAALAPTQSEPPFLVTQVVALALFITLAIAASIRFHGAGTPHIAPA
jgi:hypothetical protein